MTKNILFSLLVATTMLVFACSKSSNDSGSDAPIVPNAQYNNSNLGLYNGVFVGSKGIVRINMNNDNDNKLTATFKVDGVDYNFNSTATITQGQPVTANFSGPSGSFTFTCDANGANPAVSSLVFTGHPNAAVAVIKSLSYSWADMFQCTYKEDATGGETGVFMIAIVNHVVTGLGTDDALLYTYHISGTQSGQNVVCTTPITGGVTDIIGTVSTDNSKITGTFSNMYGTGTWKGDRVTF